VLGLTADEVRATHRGSWDARDVSDCENIVRWRATFRSLIKQRYGRSPSPAEQREFWLTLCLGRSGRRRAFPESSWDKPDDWDEVYAAAEKCFSPDSVVCLQDVISSAWRAAWRECSFFITKSGHFGLASGANSIQPGDRIYVLAGCRHLACLRRSKRRADAWEKVAFAYVNGRYFLSVVTCHVGAKLLIQRQDLWQVRLSSTNGSFDFPKKTSMHARASFLSPSSFASFLGV